MLFVPVVTDRPAKQPTAVLYVSAFEVVFEAAKAAWPIAVFLFPFVSADKADVPKATLNEAVVIASLAKAPTATLLVPVVIDRPALKPTAVL